MTIDHPAPPPPPRAVTRTYLEMRSPDALRPAPLDDPAVRVVPRIPCTVDEYRVLYDTVGAEWHWRDRLAWSDERLAEYLASPDVAVWVLEVEEHGRRILGGYFELARHADGSVELVYFGLVRACHGRGLGKALLTRAVREAWALGARRVWLHTCTLDGPAALPNYLARGFVPYREERYVVPAAG